MARTLTVSSRLLTSIDSVELTPAQRAAVWEIAAVLDEQRVPADQDDAVWIAVPAQRLRGSDGRNDNAWLKQLLDRLIGVKFAGTHKDGRWGGVLIAEYRLEERGSMLKLLLPPTGIRALRAPDTFAKIDAEAAHRLPPHARTLYGVLADKQRQRVQQWTPELDELKALVGCADKYKGRFDAFKRRVLNPAVQAIREFGVIQLDWEPVRYGRSVHWVRFRWDFKDPHTATNTAVENQRHSGARGKDAPEPPTDAAPLAPGNKPGDGGDEQIDLDEQARAKGWWESLTANQRAPWRRFLEGQGVGANDVPLTAWRRQGKPDPERSTMHG